MLWVEGILQLKWHELDPLKAFSSGGVKVGPLTPILTRYDWKTRAPEAPEPKTKQKHDRTAGDDF